MLDAGVKLINEEFHAGKVSPTQLDRLLADGWRHFGTHFFRYSLGFYGFDIRAIVPLRIRLDKFSLSKSQRRILRKNSDLDIRVRPIEITDLAVEMFERHKLRFADNIPTSLYNFLSTSPADVPCDARELCVYYKDRLVAVSYFDLGARSTSGIYAMFDPDEQARGLGIFTMLKEIEFAYESGREFYYPGYCYEGESFYDYKKRFLGLEAFDWNGNWKPYNSAKQPIGHIN